MNRPETTLFMLMSVDGKISTGDTDALDFDQDLKQLPGVKEGLGQYYDLEKQTDACFFQTGRTFAKIGINERDEVAAERIPVTGVIVDNQPHLTEQGIRYLSGWLERVVIVTTNPSHPANGFGKNVSVFCDGQAIDFRVLFETIKTDFHIDRMTIQSGGTMNAQLFRAGLIDHLSIVIAPVLIGGANTPTLVDGESLHTLEDLRMLRPLDLISCAMLKGSYVHLRYDVLGKGVRS